MLKPLLQGKPFGHPIHPALVHFPIGLFILSLLLDLFGFFMRDNLLVRAAYYAIAGGTIMGALAALIGFVDYLDIRIDHPARKIATKHMILNIVVLILFGINLGLRYADLDEATIGGFPLLLSLIGVGIVAYSGYLGGDIVYNNGIAVGRHRRETDTPKETISLRDGRDFVVVAPLSQLEEGSSLRAEIDGNVISIMRLGNEVYAIQEFCTHRFGPLSEGKIEGTEIMCPWHRSCFDIRTGKVTQGPADLDIKTYETRIEDAQIQVRVESA
jgi:uncharacterized membrane protein/nitrite reductase/ring-hydroxylating ferredoxin subunit